MKAIFRNDDQWRSLVERRMMLLGYGIDSQGNPTYTSSGGGSYAGADLSTVNPNPSLFSWGDSNTADDISQSLNVAGQWGTAIASIVTGNPVQSVSTPQGVQTIGARGSMVSSSMFSSNSGIILLLVALVVVVLLVRE